MAGDGVDFFGVEAEGSAEIDEFVEEFACLAGLAGSGQCLHKPERAGHEGAFGAR
ncbi:hypothetical protein D3C83_259780 [compost metagenome]